MLVKIKKVLHGEHGIKSATMLLVVTLFLSNVLGLVRNVVLAGRAQGLGQLDPYYAAFRLPDLVFNILVLGAISSAFIPVYTSVWKEKSQDEADRVTNTLFGSLIALVLGAMAILWFSAPVLVPLLVSKYSPEQQLQTIQLTRIMLLSPFFFSISYIIGGVLNAHKRFFTYSIAPLIYNASIITGAFLLPRFGVYGVAWAVVIGSFLHLLTQIPTLLSLGFKFNPKFNFADAAVARIIKLTIPRSFSIGMAQITLLGFTVIASQLRSGAVTIFSLTNDLQTTPAIVFGASLATAVFPTLSESVAEKQPERYQKYLHKTLRVSLFAIIPLTIVTYLLRAQAIRLYIGLGHHISWDDTIRSINTLAWFSVSFVAQNLVFVTARAFYALQDTKRPMFASIIGTIVTILFAIVLPQTGWFSAENRMDVASLAAAYSIGMWVQAILLLLWLPSNWRGDLVEVWVSIRKTVMISIAAGAATWIMLQLVGEGLHLNTGLSIDLSGIGTHTTLRLFIQGTVAFLTGAAVFIWLAKIIKMEELSWLLRFRKDATDAPSETEASSIA